MRKCRNKKAGQIVGLENLAEVNKCGSARQVKNICVYFDTCNSGPHLHSGISTSICSVPCILCASLSLVCLFTACACALLAVSTCQLFSL